MNVDPLDQRLEELAWLAEPQRKLIQRLGIATWRHLLEHYPRRYEDRTRFAGFPTGSSEDAICLRGIIQKISGQYFGRRKIVEVTLEDLCKTVLSGRVICRWFNQHYLQRMLAQGQELIVFGQELFEMAEAKGPLSDPAYQKALATLQRTADVEGLAALLGQGVEVLVGPSNGPADLIDPVWGDRRGGGSSQIAGAAAIAGYPSLTVPAGLVNGLPVGITLVTRRNQDGLLLQVARAYERAANARVPPRLMI